MNYTTELFTTGSATLEEDIFYDEHFASLFNADVVCEDPLYPFDRFESSDITLSTTNTNRGTYSCERCPCDRRISITSVIAEEEYEDEIFSPKRRKVETNELECNMDKSLSRSVTNQIILSKTSRTNNVQPAAAAAAPSLLSLLTPKQLDQQLDQNKDRLAESMKSSYTSRKLLNDHVDLQLSNYSRGALPHDHIMSSLVSSQSESLFELSNSSLLTKSLHSREHFTAFMNNMNIASRTL
jgi:hypothetical protein